MRGYMLWLRYKLATWKSLNELNFIEHSYDLFEDDLLGALLTMRSSGDDAIAEMTRARELCDQNRSLFKAHACSWISKRLNTPMSDIRNFDDAGFWTHVDSILSLIKSVDD